MMLGREEIPAVADKGMVLPLDEYMRRDGIGKDMFFPAEIETAVWKGTTYILPHATGSAGNNLLYFNKEMFRNSGLTTPSRRRHGRILECGQNAESP